LDVKAVSKYRSQGGECVFLFTSYKIKGMIATMNRTLCHISVIAAFSIGLAACTPTVANRGNIVDPDKLAELKVGETSREDVAKILGSPTQVGTFDETVWYYFGRSTEQYSFLDPKVVNQRAVEVHFDDSGILKSVQQLDPQAAKDLTPVARRTPTYGHETTILEQLVGNLGRPAGNARESKK
jgi:outer membrane protein assembly factor BamE (lipoprotein component of BamABCDE complex)